MSDFDPEFFDSDVEFNFELLNTQDGKTITLVCISDRELSPDEYAYAIRKFANKIETLLSLTDDATNTIN